jgi:hypothetical protein
MSSVMQAGPCMRSNQLDYDEDTMHKVRRLNGARQALIFTTVSILFKADSPTGSAVSL